MTKPTAAIICAAGTSSRFGGPTKKEYLPLAHFQPAAADQGVTVLSQCVFEFLQISEITTVVLAIPAGDTQKVEILLHEDKRFTNANYKKIFYVAGGPSRSESVFNALLFLAESGADTPQVLVHDGARPFVTTALIKSIIEKLEYSDAAVPAIPVIDTQKSIAEDGTIQAHLRRASLGAVQTPQGFHFQKLLAAYKHSRQSLAQFTDDSEIYAQLFPEEKIATVSGEQKNIKITYAADGFQNPVPLYSECRVGFGYDVHRLVRKRRLVLGGVPIPFPLGEQAHSDGDVLLHAITDALLGAAGFADIGELFPPSDQRWKNANSATLLRMAWQQCRQKFTCRIINIDCAVVLEKPKLLPYRQQIRQSIAEILELPVQAVFIKGKTAEKLGAIGKMRAVEAYAVVSLARSTH